MARFAGLIAALGRSALRNLGRFGALAHNNLFVVIALLMANEPTDRPSSTAPFYLVIGILCAMPSAGDMARRIPTTRLELWPLRWWERAALRAFNLLLNPMLFVAVAFAALSRDRAIGGALLIAGLAAPFALSGGRIWRNPPSLMRLAPSFPGRLGGLVQNRLRELLQSLDVWLAALLSLGGYLYRTLDAHADPMAQVVIGGLVVILLSTLAQANSSFEAESAVARGLLLPLTGRDVLLARDLAWLVLMLVVGAPCRWVDCLSAGFVALAAGHRTMLAPPMEQTRWQFASGQLAPTGLLQIAGIVLAVSTAQQFGFGVLPVCVGAWWASLEWFGRKF